MGEGLTYRERRARRAERLREWAAKRAAKGEAATASARQTADMIPLGQPILVGHHSEGRHRRDLERIDARFRKGYEHRQKAAEFESRAANIERAAAGSIYRDDPDALEALERRINELEHERDRVRRFNASVRKGAPDESLLTERQRSGLESARRVGMAGKGGQMPAYVLSNLGGSISKQKQRLEELRKSAAARPKREPDPDDDPGGAPAAKPKDDDDHGGGAAGYSDEEREALNSDYGAHFAHAPGSLWPAIRAHVGGIRITNKQSGRKDYDREDIPGGLARVKATADYPDRLGEKLIPLFGHQAEDWDADTALEHLRREYAAYKELPTKVRLRLHGRTLSDHDRAAAAQRRHLKKLDAAIDREKQRHRLRHAAARRAIAFYTDEDGIVHPITVAA